MLSNTLSSVMDAIKRSTPSSRDKDDHPITDKTLNEIGRGQWVRDRILDAHPELRTNFKDYDGDGVVGNIEDFIRYYEKNHEIIEQSIPFFRWAAAMDPHKRSIYNPIHDYLSLAYDDDPASDIEHAYSFSGSVIADVRQFHGASSPQTIVTLLHREFASARKGSFLVLGAAYQFDLIDEAGGVMSIPRADGSVRDVTVDELYGDFYADHGRMLEGYGNFERARNRYADALFLDPSLQSIYYRLGGVLHELEKYREAVSVYDAALARNPCDAKALAGRGAVFVDLKEYTRAGADFRDTLRLDPTSAPAHIGLGRIQHIKKNHKEARQHYTNAIKADPQNALGYYWRAVAWDDERRPRRAVADFLRAIKCDRRLAAAFHGLALIQHDAGQYESAYRNLRAAMRRQQRNAVYYKDLGILLSEWRRPTWGPKRTLARAFGAFNRALEIDPKLVSALNARGNLWCRQGSYLKALADYEKAERIDTENPETMTNLGFLYSELNKPSLAHAYFLKATMLDPKRARAWYGLGLVLHKHGAKIGRVNAEGKDPDIAALKAFGKAIDLDEKYAEAYYGRSLVWMKLEKWGKSLSDLDRCLDNDRNNADAYYQRSEVKRKLRDHAGATVDYHIACDRLKSRLCERK